MPLLMTHASTAVSFATRGLGNYGAGTWVENFANGVESYNTIWQIGDFAKKINDTQAQFIGNILG